MLSSHTGADASAGTVPGHPAVGALIEALRAGGAEASLAAVARVVADWPAVCGATMEVFAERPGRPPLVIGQHRPPWPGEDARAVCLDLRDRERVIGRLTVTLDDSEPVPPELPALCATAATLAGGLAARLRLEAILLDMESYEVAGQIAAGLVHDFNNMLTGIMGNAALLGALLEPDSPLRAPLQRIEESSGAAAALARALLNFVRGSTRREPLAMNEIVTGIRKVVTRSIREGVRVHLDLAPDVPMVEGERSLLQQAIVNLLLNAADAIAGEGSITLRTRCADAVPADVFGIARPSARYLALSVEDTGAGIAADLRAEIFRPFFSTKGAAGTGLGLPSVLQVVRRHAGAVHVESRIGLGTTFTIYLPEASPDAEAEGAGEPGDALRMAAHGAFRV